MPTYQYECLACTHSFEVMQMITGNRLKKCPKCGRNKLSRLLGAGSGIIFKGSGFYETDYKKKAPSKSESGSKEPSKKTPGAEANKTSPSQGHVCCGSCQH